MSDERRKRQQEREGPEPKDPVAQEASQKKMLVWAGIVLVGIGIYAAVWYHLQHRYDNLAKCLTSKGVKMYGLYWCPHCAEQKEKLGKSFQYVTYVECAIKGSSELTPACKQAGVKLFPSWQFAGNPPNSGVLTIDELADKSGCAP